MRQIHAITMAAAAVAVAAGAVLVLFAADGEPVIDNTLPTVAATPAATSSENAPDDDTPMTVPAIPEESLDPTDQPEPSYREDITGG